MQKQPIPILNYIIQLDKRNRELALLNFKSLFIAFTFMTVLAGCVKFHEAQPVNLEQKVNSVQDRLIEPGYKLPGYQVILKTEDAWGMGVIISPKKIATAAHVISDKVVGDIVSVKYAKGVNERYQNFKAVVKYVDASKEVAVLELQDGVFPTDAAPALCEHSYGGNRLSSLVPISDGERFSPYTGLIAFTSNIDKMPKVTDAFNKESENGGHPPQDAEGQPRVTAFVASTTQHGNSGGALYDVDQQCVVGIISLGAKIVHMDAPETVINKLGILGNQDLQKKHLLFAIPISAYANYK